MLYYDTTTRNARADLPVRSRVAYYGTYLLVPYGAVASTGTAAAVVTAGAAGLIVWRRVTLMLLHSSLTSGNTHRRHGSDDLHRQ